MNAARPEEVEEPVRARVELNRFRRVRIASTLAILLLVLQFLIGMGTNLFVMFPAETASVNPLDSVFASGPFPVLIHILVGLTLGILSIGTLVLSLQAKKGSLVLLALSGLGTMLLAGESGIEFVLGWYSDDLFSFLMSLGFILSFTVYFVLLWSAQTNLIRQRMGEGLT